MSLPKILMFLPFLFLGLLAGCDQSQTPEQPSEQQLTQQSPEPETAEPESEVTEKVQPEWTPESAARALLAMIVKGQYEKAAETFGPEVKAAFPAEKLKTTWEAVQTQIGRYQSVGKNAKVQKIKTNNVVDLLCTFELAKLVFRVSYNDKQRVVGIFFKSAPP